MKEVNQLLDLLKNSEKHIKRIRSILKTHEKSLEQSKQNINQILKGEKGFPLRYGANGYCEIISNIKQKRNSGIILVVYEELVGFVALHHLIIGWGLFEVYRKTVSSFVRSYDVKPCLF